jgi:hypothetical protein
MAKYREWCYPVYDLKKNVIPKQRDHVTVE